MRVLVTGGAGFLGAHILRNLLARGHEPTAFIRPGKDRPHLGELGVPCVEGDVLDESSIMQACRGVDAMIHAAGRTGMWSRHNDEQRKVNVEGTTYAMRAAHKAHLERIVHVSTVGAVAGSEKPVVHDESAVWNLSHLRINYVKTKREAEDRAFAAAHAGMPVVVVNPSFLLGPRLDGRPPSPVVTGVAEGRINWVPDGGVSLAHVEDVAEGIVSALERGQVNQRYILAGHNLTWAELYPVIAEVTGGKAPRRRLPFRVTRALAVGAEVLDLLRLSRPPWAPERLRSFGMYGFFDSSKAEQELDYKIRPLEEIIRSCC
jgi:dihydroflavonol-4-reductase